MSLWFPLFQLLLRLKASNYNPAAGIFIPIKFWVFFKQNIFIEWLLRDFIMVWFQTANAYWIAETESERWRNVCLEIIKMLKGFNLAGRSMRAKFDSRDAKVLRAVINSNPDLVCKLSINKGPEGHIMKLIIDKFKTCMQSPGYMVNTVAVFRRSYCRGTGRWLFVLKQNWDSFLRRPSGSQSGQEESCVLLQPAALTWVRYMWLGELQQEQGSLWGKRANVRECTSTPSAASSSAAAAVGRAAVGGWCCTREQRRCSQRRCVL